MARLLNLSPALSDYGLRMLTGGARSLDELVADDARSPNTCATTSRARFMSSGTCRMGARDDRRRRRRLHRPRASASTGLRVADASVMPTVPRGNTNLPTLMIAEKLAAAMLAN